MYSIPICALLGSPIVTNDIARRAVIQHQAQCSSKHAAAASCALDGPPQLLMCHLVDLVGEGLAALLRLQRAAAHDGRVILHAQ